MARQNSIEKAQTLIIFPYSSALRIAKNPYVTYGVVLSCVAVFLAQLGFSVTESLMYYPLSWNPLTMVTSSLAHGDFIHITGNLIFFMAFAPALEIIIGNNLKFIIVLLFISFVVGIGYSVSVIVGNTTPLPTLGLSGVVMGMIGLSAFLMPQARIKVFCWFIIFWKTFYIPAWILAVAYIGIDVWTMIMSDNYHGINIVAHVAGGFAGYAFGFFWLRECREETREQLDNEIEAMDVKRKYGDIREEAFRYKKATEGKQVEKQKVIDHDKFMGSVYQCVKTHRDAEAICLLVTRYDDSTDVIELEDIYKRVEEWGPSRTLLCLGRLIISRFDEDKRFGRALIYLEKCQSISPQFVLADLSKTLFYARFAMETSKQEVAKNLLIDADKRYGSLVNQQQCLEFLQQILKTEIDIIL